MTGLLRLWETVDWFPLMNLLSIHLLSLCLILGLLHLNGWVHTICLISGIHGLVLHVGRISKSLLTLFGCFRWVLSSPLPFSPLVVTNDANRQSGSNQHRVESVVLKPAGIFRCATVGVLPSRSEAAERTLLIQLTRHFC